MLCRPDDVDVELSHRGDLFRWQCVHDLAGKFNVSMILWLGGVRIRAAMKARRKGGYPVVARLTVFLPFATNLDYSGTLVSIFSMGPRLSNYSAVVNFAVLLDNETHDRICYANAASDKILVSAQQLTVQNLVSTALDDETLQNLG